MTYEPTEWKTGDVVTSAKLNKLEQGVADASGGGGVLVVGMTMDVSSGTPALVLDKTAGEIWGAGFAILRYNGATVFEQDDIDRSAPLMLAACGQPDSIFPGYSFTFPISEASDDISFLAETADDYPTATQG